MTDRNLKAELLPLAESLRPEGKAFVSLLNLAEDLGIAVSLHMQTASPKNTAQIDLRSHPPRIIISRFAKVAGEREITAPEESLLTPRERFSVAHELGHWIAHSRLQVDATLTGSQYWKQEEMVNFFASHLLVPDWLADRWLSETDERKPISPFAVRHWAEQCRVSEEVITKALVRRRGSIGFLKVSATRRKGDQAPILQVLSCAQGSNLRLPNERSYIDHPVLQATIRDGKIGSTIWFSGICLGRCGPQSVGITWRRAARFKSEETTWLSLVAGELGDANEGPSTSLFDY